eukprot:1317561-Amphidinium_carterae.2
MEIGVDVPKRKFVPPYKASNSRWGKDTESMKPVWAATAVAMSKLVHRTCAQRRAEIPLAKPFQNLQPTPSVAHFLE